MLKPILFAGVAAFAFVAGTATAQAQSMDWGGSYLGVYGSWVKGIGSVDDAYCASNINSPDPDNCSDPGDPTDTPELYGAPVDDSSAALGLIFGYNIQTSSGLVFGFETDTGIGGTFEGHFESSVFGENPDQTGELKLTQTGSARLRAGMAVDKFLPYITAGLAYAHYEVESNHTSFASGNRNGDGNLLGWTAGAGVNYAVTNNFIAGLEYRYTDYGSDTFIAFSDFDVGTQSYEMELQQHEIRATLTYLTGNGVSGAAQSGGPWTGFYAGAFGGYAMASGITDNSFCQATLGEPDPDNCSDPGDPTDIPETYGAPVDGNALTLGVLMGYNHQFSNGLVMGAEVDLGFGGKANGNFEGSESGVNADHTAEFDIGLNGSARTRIGFAVDNFMPYITGGVAFAQYDVSMADLTQADQNRNGSGALLGWTAGAGLNYMMANNIIFGVEYRYTDFGTDTHLFSSAADTDFWTQEGELDQHEVRASVAYKF
jgi:outer membrane immunogenic protein